MEELISVIVPVYNAEKYLDKCVESIINQSYKNLQIILIDDGSKDKSGKICDEYAKKDKRIEVTHKENAGVSAARNTGVEKAKGEWITFIDADDWIEKDYCTLLHNVAKNDKCEIVLCGYNRVVENKKEKINTNINVKCYDSEEYLKKTLNPQTGFGFCTMRLIKKSIIQDKFCEDVSVCEDALFNIGLSKAVMKAELIGIALYNYRINNSSVVRKYDEKYSDKYLNAMKKIKEYIEIQKYNQEIMQNYYNFVAFHVMLIAVNYCYNMENKSKNRRKILSLICKEPEFLEGIKKSNYKNISLTRKVTLFSIKHKMYFITEQICIFRQKQNNKKREKK